MFSIVESRTNHGRKIKKVRIGDRNILLPRQTTIGKQLAEYQIFCRDNYEKRCVIFPNMTFRTISTVNLWIDPPQIAIVMIPFFSAQNYMLYDIQKS